MRPATTILAACFALATASCWPVWFDDGADDRDDGWCECSYHGETTCWGYDTLGVCEDGCEYSLHDCDALCVGAGFTGSAGCGWDPESYEHVCWCTDEPACDCSAGDTECWGSGFVMTCDDGCRWTTWDCHDLCVDAGHDRSTGCGYDGASGDDACFCESDAACDCSHGEMACWDDWSIGSCDDGCWWAVYDCEELCMGSGWDYTTGCAYDVGAGEDACFCESY